MTKYIIYENNNGIMCLQSIDGTTRYIKTSTEIARVIRNITKEDFNILVKNKDVILENDRNKYILKNAKSLFKQDIFKIVVAKLEKDVKKYGYKKITTDKNPKFKNKKVLQKLTALSLLGGVSVGLIAAALKRDGKDFIPEEPKQEVVEITDVDNLNNTNVMVYELDEEEIKEEEIKEEEIKEKQIDSMEIDFEDLSDSSEAKKTKEYYYEIIKKYAHLYGLDPDLVLGVATQERRVHSSTIDKNGGLGIMQIQYGVWLNADVSCFKLNEETGEYEKTVVKFTDERLRNLETNIEAGCIVLQNCLAIAHYNVPLALQMYNMGEGTMNSILNDYAGMEGKTINEIVSDPTDDGWLKYRDGYRGDQSYIENVNKWVYDNEYNLIDVYNDNREVNFEFTNDNERSLRK